MVIKFVFFFFQAEDGIRDGHVTGVQTCALPISCLAWNARSSSCGRLGCSSIWFTAGTRSEERRVGKECRYRWAPDHEKKKQVEARRWRGVMLNVHEKDGGVLRWWSG